MPAHPAATLTLVFTDIEGSTRVLQQLGPTYANVLAEHRRLIREACTKYEGDVVETEGDAFFMAFARAQDAIQAAIAAQRSLHTYSWPEGATLRVRMGIHTGTPDRGPEGYVGLDVHRTARIAAAANGGQVLISEVTRALLGADLPPGVGLRELGEHRLKDLEHPVRLFQLVIEGLPDDFRPPRSLSVMPNNLPIQLTSFVGRDREIGEIEALLASKRLVTLTGAGGSGKTRLALQAATDLLEALPDGVWWVDLAPLSNADLVPQAVATVLGVREQAGRGIIELLRDKIGASHLLLVLDNCEHVLIEVARLSDLLVRGCPHLRILATSREGLAIAGEHLYPVAPLGVPNLREPLDPARLLEYDALRLFVDRARAVKSDFNLTDDNAETLARICARLDGIPLAIEMAAARVRAIPIEEIASRLQDRFRLLVGGRTSLPRHQTLRAAMDWSHDLLSPAERLLFRRLGVFVGSFSLEAAEAICAGDGISSAEVLELVTGLLDKSLVLPDPDARRARYRMLETVRQYARDRLLDAEEAEVVAGRHLAYFVELAQKAVTPTIEEATQWMDPDQDNFRAALEWAWSRQALDSAYRLVEGFYRFWNRYAFWTEGLQWMNQLLASARDVEVAPRTLGILHYGSGLFAFSLGDLVAGSTNLEASLGIFRSLDNSTRVASALDMLGVIAYRQGDYERAASYLAESATLQEAAGPRSAFNTYLRGIVSRLRGQYDEAERLGKKALAQYREAGALRRDALTLDSLAMLAYYRGRYVEATDLATEALGASRGYRDKFGILGSLNTLALVGLAQGKRDMVRRLCEECLAVSREVGAKHGIARALQTRGQLALREGQVENAERDLVESLSMFSALGERLGITRCLTGLASVALIRGNASQAATLLAGASAIRRAMGMVLPIAEREEATQLEEETRSRLASEAFAAAWEAGESMDAAQAVDFALGASRQVALPDR